jgi:large subunit ribosomal protein L1
MPAKRSKRYRAALEQIEEGRKYSLEEATALLKKLPAPNFDPTLTLSFNLNVDPRKADQMVRGSVPLPHGIGKDVVVVVFATGDAAIAAQNAGADEVGYEALIEKVKGGWTDFDAAIATPDAMAEVRKLGRQLGPRGLMPNPKTGTVTDDTAAAVKAAKAGKVDFKVDRGGNIALAIGKLSFVEEHIEENAQAVVDAILRAKPASAKGNYMKSATLSASMLPGLAIDSAPFVRS